MARQRGARDLGRAAPQRGHRRAAHRSVARKAELAAGSRAALINDPAEGVRIGGVLHAVEDDLRDRRLARVGFGRGLIIDRLRQAAPRVARLGERDGRHNERPGGRSEEHTSELQSLMRISYAVFCLKKKNKRKIITDTHKLTYTAHMYEKL